MVRLVCLSMLAALAVVLAACSPSGSSGSAPAELQTKDLLVVVETEGGAGVLGDLSVSGHDPVNDIKSYKDLIYSYRVEPGASVTGTFVRYPNQGRLVCSVSVDGKTVFEQVTDSSDDTCNIVLTVGGE